MVRDTDPGLIGVDDVITVADIQYLRNRVL